MTTWYEVPKTGPCRHYENPERHDGILAASVFGNEPDRMIPGRTVRTGSPPSGRPANHPILLPSTMQAPTLGEARFPSPIGHKVSDDIRLPKRIVPGADPGLLFELADPREKLFFNPKETIAGIVTCGGLCPGLNNAIRSFFYRL